MRTMYQVVTFNRPFSCFPSYPVMVFVTKYAHHHLPMLNNAIIMIVIPMLANAIVIIVLCMILLAIIIIQGSASARIY